MVLLKLYQALFWLSDESTHSRPHFKMDIPSLKARLEVPPQFKVKYEEFKKKMVEKKLNIQFLCFYLLFTIVAIYRVAQVLLYGENIKRAALVVVLLAVLYSMDKLKNRYPNASSLLIQIFLTLWHFGITEIGLQKATY